MILQRRDDARGDVDEWIEIVVGERLDDALFIWAGPARSAQEWAAAEAAAIEDAQARLDRRSRRSRGTHRS